MPSPTVVVGKTVTTRAATPPGIATGGAYADLDALGTAFYFDVPRSGMIVSANYYDLDDEGLQVDLWLLTENPTLQTDNAALALENGDILKVIKRLQFTSFGDGNLSQSSELDNIGRAYMVPARRIWAQAQARGALNIAALNLPAFSLTILADE